MAGDFCKLYELNRRIKAAATTDNVDASAAKNLERDLRRGLPYCRPSASPTGHGRCFPLARPGCARQCVAHAGNLPTTLHAISWAHSPASPTAPLPPSWTPN